MQFQVSKFCFLDVYEYPDVYIVLIVSFTSSKIGSKINFRFIRGVIFDGGLINCVRKAFEFGMEGILIEWGAARATSKKGKRERKIPLQILRVAVSLLPFPLKLTFEELVSTGGERRVYAVGIPPPFKLFFFRRTDVSHVRA